VAQNAKKRSMNASPKSWLKTGAKSSALLAKELHALTGKAPPGQVDTPEALAKLPVWRQWSTTLEAKVYPTGAAILPHATHKFEFGKPQREILKAIEFHKHGFVRQFLKEVVFWHHRSTNGRFNDKLKRFERWGVRSVEEWIAREYKAKEPNPNYAWQAENIATGKAPWYMSKASKTKTVEKPMLKRRTFFEIRDRLVAMGLIESHAHMRLDPQSHHANADGAFLTKALWIKPTDELSRILFEPGYWETVKAKYAFVTVKGKPRGMHAPKGKSDL
jgi:hypothetical protein